MKYYAVKRGRVTGILNSWEETEKSVKGFKGAKYKSFGTREEAKQYLLEDNEIKAVTTFSKEELNGIHMWTDGTYKDGRTGYGILIVIDGDIKEEIYGECASTSSRNVQGEVVAVLKAIQLSIDRGYEEITIHYDYLGIGAWLTGEWEVGSDIGELYVKDYYKLTEKIKCTLLKTIGHDIDGFNRKVDLLAKKGIGIIEE